VREVEQRDDQRLRALGEAVRQIRLERGIDTAALAAALGVKPTRIEALEAGESDPRFELLLALAEALGVRPSALTIRAEALQGGDPGASLSGRRGR